MGEKGRREGTTVGKARVYVVINSREGSLIGGVAVEATNR